MNSKDLQAKRHSPLGRVLTVNGGSSSIKFALFDPGDSPTRVLGGKIDRVGRGDSTLRVTGRDRSPHCGPIVASNLREAVAHLLDWLEQDGSLHGVAAIGHRVVHGGVARFNAQPVTAELLVDLRAAIPLDPTHLPAEIALIEALSERLPGVEQIVCLDTTFHQNLPTIAQLLPIPRRYIGSGVRRYGFHGLSYTYLFGELERQAGATIAQGRVILAHLGSGSSLAAIRGGQCIDTTMGFTPASGLVMGTRTGDIDPGVLIYLARSAGLTADQLDDLVNHQSGLLGVSETSSDMKDLLASSAYDPRAAEAIEYFCYQARKWIGAFVAVLGGLDALVFAGGVGENSAEIRSRICDGLEFFGVRLDPIANQANAPIISDTTTPAAVLVIPTDEEIVIARTVYDVARGSTHPL